MAGMTDDQILRAIQLMALIGMAVLCFLYSRPKD